MLISFLFKAHRISTHKLESINQSTIICSIIRLLFKNKQYQIASQVIAKTTFSEKAPNSQIARYNYYIGLLKAIQLEYSEAQAHLQEALRKAPENKATGFKIAVSKILVVVELLMGEIPNRQVFSQHFESMKAYYQVVKAVRRGQLAKFRSVLNEWGKLFERDDTLSLISRLRHNVIKFGLRNINLSYSRITLKDVMLKLNLNAENQTQAICAKAIRDGVIDAKLSHEEQFVQMKDLMDLYQTNQPQQAMGKRINFCIKLYQEAAKALEYPYEDQIKRKQKKKPQEDKKEADKGKEEGGGGGDQGDDSSGSDYNSNDDDDDLIGDDDLDLDDFEL